MRSRAIFLFAGAICALAQTPVVTENGVLNGASFAVGQPVTAGSLVSIFGTGLAPELMQASSVPLPYSLGVVSVTFNSIPAPLLFVAPTQINAQLPFELPSSGVVSVVVTRGGTPSSPRNVQLGPSSPAIFTLSSGTGQAIAINPDGSLAAPQGSVPGVPTRPAAPGSVVVILGAGLGAVNPAGRTAFNSSDAIRNTTTTPTVLVGGRQANVLFSGLSPEFVGVNQVNVQIPEGVVGGDRVPLQIRMGSSASSGQVTLAIAGTGVVRNLVQVTSVPILGSNPRTVALNGNFAYVCGSENVTVVDISDPQNARATGRVADEVFNTVGNLNCYMSAGRLVATADTGSTLVTGTSPSVAVFDVSNPAQPQLIRASAINKQFMAAGYVRGNTVIVPTNAISFSGSTFQDQRGDLLALDITDPNNGRVAGTLFTGQPGFNALTGGPNNFFTAAPATDALALAGSSTSTGAATSTGTGRVMVVDISNPASLTLVRDVLISGTRQIVRLAVEGNLAIALGNVEGWRNPINFPLGAQVGPTVVTTLDLSNPGNPAVLRTVSTPARPDLRGSGAAALGASQYVFGGTRVGDQPAFLLVDARDRNNPGVTTVPAPVTVNDVNYANGYVYTALEGSGLGIYRLE
jgi:uncharacterized protein (TIGR03437 family)